VKLIDRYIFGTLVVSFAICLLGMLALYVLIDALDRLEDFTEHARLAGGSTAALMLRYYLIRLPLFYVQVAPAIMLMASMFTMTRMVRFNELVPLCASGISAYRAMRIHVAMALLCALSMMAVQEAILPRLADEIAVGSVVAGGATTEIKHRQMVDREGRIYYFEQILPFQQVIWLPRVVQRHPVTGRRMMEISAARATWTQVDERQLRLRFHDGELRRFASERLTLLPGYPHRFSGEQEYLDLSTDLSVAEMFKPRKIDIEFASSAQELLDKINEDPQRYTVRMSLHLRFALPLATLVLLALGLPLVIGTETGNAFLGVGLCILIAAAFYVVLTVSINLGNKALIKPLIATWGPLVLFGSIGAGFVAGVRT
jgi:lipopolysaccharide export system permease protein